MQRSAALLPAAALLVGPAVAAFFDGGIPDGPRLGVAVGAALLLAVAAVVAPRREPAGSGGAALLLPVSTPGRVALAALAGLAGWTAIAKAWSPLPGAADQALELALLYLLVAGAASLLLRERPVARLAEPALAAGAVAAVGYGLAGRLVPAVVELEASIRAGGRLEQPLGYWNGMGVLAVLGLVLAARVAGDPTRDERLRAAFVAAMPVLGAGVHLSFSRAALAAAAVGLLALVACAPSREQARAALLSAIAVGLGAAATAPFDAVRTLAPTGAADAQGLGALALLAAAALLLTGAFLLTAGAGRPLPRRARPWLAAAAVLAALVPFAAALADRADEGAETFGATSSRLTEAGSNRSAYWRAGARALADEPLRGTGAGSFGAVWLQERTIDERVRNAHSLYVETAVELGPLGLALLLAAFGGVALAARRLLATDAALAAGPAAALAAWAVHAGVDWDWQIPAVTGVAAVLAGLVLARAGGTATTKAPPLARGETHVAGEAPGPGLTPPPGHPRFPLLDGVRAIAALTVVGVHISDASGFSADHPLGTVTAQLNVGVAIFFVLSGFLLYRPFAAARVDGRPRPRVTRYLRRRLLRIVPAFWTAMLVMLALGWIGFQLEWWKYFFFLQSYSVAGVFSGIRPAWTLDVEMAYYLVLPLWVVAAAAVLRGRPRATQLRAELLGLAGLALASLALRIGVLAESRVSLTAISLPTYLDWFAGGMALALLSLWLEDHHPRGVLAAVRERPWIAWAAALALYLVVALAVPLPASFESSASPAANVAQHVLYALIAVLVALPAVIGGARGPVAGILGHPVVAWLGLVSYGTFLWHQPLIDQLTTRGIIEELPGSPVVMLTLLAVPGGVALGALSYYLVERPFLALKDPRRANAGSARVP